MRVMSYVFSALFCLFVCVPVMARAQSTTTPPQAIVLATVNIQNAQITKQDGHAFSISFDLTNREGVQHDVDYSVELIQDDNGQFVADQNVYLAHLILQEHSSTHQTITYTAPASLDGTYRMFISSKNASGFPFGVAYVKDVTLVSSSDVRISPHTCYLTVKEDKKSKHYMLTEGVDIAKDETIHLTCVAENTSDHSVSIIPEYQTRFRSEYGDNVPHVGGSQDPIVLPQHKTTQFTLELPKATKPQAYSVNISFGASHGIGSILVHYVLRGASATIQNISLDQNRYAAGDTALVSFMWTPSADGFPDSRAGTSSPSVVSFQAILTNRSGAVCGELTQSLPPTMVVHAPLSIAVNCLDPHLSLDLRDVHGVSLARGVLVVQSPVRTFWIYLIFICIVSMVVLLWFLRKKMRARVMAPMLVMGVIVLLPGYARGDTVMFPFGQASGPAHLAPITFTFNLDKSSYTPGSALTLTSYAEGTFCGNTVFEAYAYFVANLQGDWRTIMNAIVGQWAQPIGGNGWFGIHSESDSGYHTQIGPFSTVFTAPSYPGTYPLYIYAAGAQADLSGRWFYDDRTVALYFTVTGNSCWFNGTPIAHGGSTYAYPTATSVCGVSGQVRVCNNGVLSGSYPYSSCISNQAPLFSINSVTADSACTINKPYYVALSATDPENDKVRYEIQWNDGSPVESVPNIHNTPSGIVVTPWLGAWTDSGSTLPAELLGSQTSVIGTYIYLFGGQDKNGSAIDAIYRAPVSNPTSWVDTGAKLPARIFASQRVIIGDYVYLFGGYNTGPVSSIYRAPISNPLAWVDTGATLPGAPVASEAAIIGDFVYLFGGYTDDIYRAPVSNPLAWVKTGAKLPGVIGWSSLAVVGDYVYLFGGNTGEPRWTNVIWRAPVSNPLAWTDTGAHIPSTLDWSQAQVIGDYVYLFGGYTDAGGSQHAMNTVYRAPVSNPLSWADTGLVLPDGLAGSQAVSVGGAVYMLGGFQNNRGRSNVIYTAPLKQFVPSGTVVSVSHTYATSVSPIVSMSAIDMNGMRSNVVTLNRMICAVSMPPTVHAIVGSSSGGSACVVNQPYTLTMQATDPEGDQLKYEIDWGDGSAHSFAPLSGYVPSGTAQTVSHTYAAYTASTIKVHAIDTGGNVSAEQDSVFSCECPHVFHCNNQTIEETLSNCSVHRGDTCVAPKFCSEGASVCYAPPSFNQIPNPNNPTGANLTGHLQAIPSLVRKGSPVKLYWSVGNVSRCSVSSSDSAAAHDRWSDFASTNAGVSTSAIQSQTIYTLQCSGQAGSFTETATVNLAPVTSEK